MSGKADDKQRAFAKEIDKGLQPGTRVVYLGDSNHFRTAEIYGSVLNKPFWDEMGHNGKTNIVATERYVSTRQPLFDAFFNKQITRAEFLSTLDSGKTAQMTEAESRKLAEGFADIMEKGIRVIPANNAQEQGDENYLRAAAEETAMQLDGIRWRREHRNEINKDPQAAALHQLEKNDHTALSGPVREIYVQAKKAILDKIEKNEPITLDHVAILHDIASPHFAAYLEYAGKVEPESDLVNNKKRAARDDQIVATIQQAAEQPNSRVFLLYGVAHATGPDGIMAQLRQNGLQAELVIPTVGKDHFECKKMDNLACEMMGPKEMENWFKKEMRDANYTQIPVNEPTKKFEHKAGAPVLGPS